MKKKKRFPKTRKAIKLGLIGTVLFHGATQLAYLANDLYHKINPSDKRAAFEEQFGFPIKGWSEDIEEQKDELSRISSVVAREMQSKPFNLPSFNVKSSNYLKQMIIDQVHSVFADGINGYCNPFTHSVTIDDDCSPETASHEIKHAKTYDVMKSHPEFLDKWKALALDSNGNSLYYSTGEILCSYVRGLDRLVDGRKRNTDENEKLGFISNYARTNVLEDIAEICEEAERYPGSFKKWIFDNSSGKNEIIKKKIELAQEYGIISPQFTDFIKLEEMYMRSAEYRGSINQDKAKPFMEQSAKFLQEHPNNVYESELRSHRAYVLDQGRRGTPPYQRNTVEDTIAEYYALLNAKFKEGSSYITALQHLAELHRDIRDEKTANIFSKAEDIYWKRFHDGDAKLSSRGVNDFLKDQGIDLTLKGGTK